MISMEPLDSKTKSSQEQEYSDLKPLLEAFCEEIKHQIDQLLKESDIILGFPVQIRVKTWESVAEKLKRIPRINHFRNIQDIVGLRIILLFNRDVSKVVKFIENNFIVIKQYDTQERLKEDQFGYSSKHLIVQLNKNWLSLPSLSKMGELSAEIQVRTLPQHIWAEASHHLQYKQENNIPPTVRRSIYRVSALLETIDLEFERVLEERDVYRNGLVKDITTSDDENLNVDLLETLLDNKLPAINKSPNEDYATLLTLLRELNIKTKKQLVKVLDKHINDALVFDAETVGNLLEMQNSGIESLPSYILSRARKKVYLSHTGLVRQALRLEFPEISP
jgi:putative GTP pyrophosphokinase